MGAYDLTAGRQEPGKNSVGGLKAVYFVTSGMLTPADLTYDVTNTDAIATATPATTAVQFDLRGANTFDETVTSSREMGTTFYEGKLSLKLKKLSMKDHKELKLLAFGRPQCVVEDNNGNYFFCGLKNGLDVTGGTIARGGALADHSGYTLELSGEEPVPANFLSGTLAAVLKTITVGTNV